MKYLKWSSPFLAAILTVTALWAANAARLDPGQMCIPLGFALPVAGIFLLIFWLARWTARTAPLVATIFTLVFLIWYAVPAWIMVMWLLIALVLGLWKKLDPVVQKIMVIIPLILFIAIPVSLIQGAVIHVGDQGQLEDHPVIPGQPNIYFICPDRMPSPAAMMESGIDPAEAIQYLQDLGFYVPEDLVSLDPYTWDYQGKVHTTRTMRFYAAALNGEDVPIDISYQEARSMIKQPEIFAMLQDRGYQITNVASWFNETAYFPTADFNLRFQDVSFLERLFYNELSVAYFNQTVIARLNFRVLQSDASISSVETARHDWQKNQILAIAGSGKTSQFIQSHIMLPHEPFIYTDAQEPMDQYLDQIRYALGYLGSLARGIREADPTAIIIIQSDEGMAFRKPPELNAALSLVQWNGVFAAWYISQDLDLSNINHTDILYLVVCQH